MLNAKHREMLVQANKFESDVAMDEVRRRVLNLFNQRQRHRLR